MKKSILHATLLAAALIIFAPHSAEAQHTYGYSSTTFDPSTNTVYGYSATDPDYSVQGYYQTWVIGYLIDLDTPGPSPEGGTYVDVQSMNGPGRMEVSTEARGVNDHNYKLISQHQLDAVYYEYFFPEPPHEGPETRYIDQYNYESLPGSYFELSVAFDGPGPMILLSSGVQRIDLGYTYAQLPAPAPHHLYVVSDSWGWVTACPPTAARVLRFRVVKSDNSPAGTTPVQENFLSLSENTCLNGDPQPSGCADTDAGTNGEFSDTITVNCNSVGGDCGYNITWRWEWCPLLSLPRSLGNLGGQVRSNRVTVNGVLNPPYSLAGTHIY